MVRPSLLAACLLLGCGSSARSQDAGAPDAPVDPRCLLPTDDPALRVPNGDGDDNPRPWGGLPCPTGDWLVGVVVVDLGSANPGLIDGFLAICAPRDRLGARARTANSDVAPPQAGATELELACPPDEVVVALQSADATDGSDRLRAISVVCSAPTGGPRTTLADGGLPSPVELDCPPAEIGVGLAYKDAPGTLLSDSAESITLVCRPATCP